MYDSTYMWLAIYRGLFSSARICPDDGTYATFLEVASGSSQRLWTYSRNSRRRLRTLL